MSDDETPDEVSEALSEVKSTGGRAETEAKSIEDAPAFEEAVIDAYEANDEGDLGSTVTVRDTNLAVLLEALQASGELEGVTAWAAEELGDDPDDYNLTARSAAMKLLARVALREYDAEIFDRATQARDEYESENSTHF